MEKPKRILIIRTDRLGDVILSTPVIKNLRLAFPEAHLAFLCRPYTKEVVEENPYLDEVIVYDKYGKDSSFWALIRFSLELRKKNFDWALILHPTNRMHMITFFAGIPVRVGWDKKMSWLLTKRLPHRKQEGRKHELEYTLDFLRHLNISSKDKTLYFPIAPEIEQRMEGLFKGVGLDSSSKFIVVHTSASCPSKRWPEACFSELVKILKEKLNFKIIVITSEGEKIFGQKVVDENEVIDLRGKLNILEIGALLKRAALFISNDSGPVHIAASLDTPVISIFGRKDPGLSPRRWKPLGTKSTYIHKDSGCLVCLAHNCEKNFICLGKITPREVAEKALLILN